MKPLRQVLIDARALLARPDGWTQGAMFTDQCGRELTWAQMREAANLDDMRFCAAGAIEACAFGRIEALDAQDLLLLKQTLGGQRITTWNDARDRTQAEVLAAFDRAIETI